MLKELHTTSLPCATLCCPAAVVCTDEPTHIA